MKLNLTQTIIDINGNIAEQKYKKNIINEEGVEVETIETQEITLGKAIVDSVLGQIEDVAKVDEEEHLLRYDLYERALKEEAEFTKVEIDFIKELICKRYLPIFAGQLLRLLNK